MGSSRPIQLCLLGGDSGLGMAIARNLGEGFDACYVGDFENHSRTEWKERCDVVLMDFRAGSSGNRERGLLLMDEIHSSPSRFPIVVLCDEDDRPLLCSSWNAAHATPW
jgi:hypothetical protein